LWAPTLNTTFFKRQLSAKLGGWLFCLGIITHPSVQANDTLNADHSGPIDIGQIQRTVIAQNDRATDRAPSLETEISNIALRHMGFTPQAHYYSYPRIVRALNQGTIGAGIILRYNAQWLTPNAPSFSCHQYPYLRLPLSIYKLRDNHDIPDQLDLNSLRDVSVGYMRSIGKDINPLLDQPNFLPINNMETLFKMLKSGRIDTVFADVAIAESWSRALGISLQPLLQLGALESFLCFSDRQYGADKALRLSNSFYDTLRALDAQSVIDDFLLNHNLGYYRGLYLPPIPPEQ